ncbi:short-chain dehydrogenase/reductase family 9C member 7-like isoform X2 [Schistocerca cancellata]|uniref:short-chain dehydrogenase/reductase family 9C member 7-like isoform X2 n=1 Tax=Schistocerca cancellata TaxID=274614 RepID=UPI0021184DE9|nr:short-chain dehydrogenase/reductase family 9C member 7-like isoform X2 [Schistocerca cancellata]
MIGYLSGACEAAWWCWSWSCQLVGAAALLGLAAWLLTVALDLLHPLRLVDRLHQRVVLITGCDSGFGEALARRLDSLGVPVVAGCLFPEGPGAQRLVQECSSRLRVVPLDVTSEQQVRDAVSSIRDSLDGRGRTAMPIMSPYCISKSAVISYCDALRVEMKKWGVSVCTVEPSSYMTGLNNPDHFKATISKNFQTRPLSVREAYGLDYDDKCTKRMSILTFLAKRNSSIDEVIHELVDACIGKYFQVRRIPGLWERVVYVMLPQLPYFGTDIISYLLLQWRMTVPPTAKSSEEQNETH